jgi:hypothetical protein
MENIVCKNLSLYHMSIAPEKKEKNQIIYFSKYCEHSNKLLKILSKTGEIKEKIHFLPIDKRMQKKDGRTYVVLDNGQEILMPDVIKQVPALLLLHYGNRTLFGEEILKFYRPQIDKERKVATNFNGEPQSFSIKESGTMMSDCYSYLDQSSDEMGVKGNGGLRQMHSFTKINEHVTIDTPPEDYVKERMAEDALKNYQEQRQKSIN